MQVHGSCAARGSAGVLLTGPPGSGKSDLVLRLRAFGFSLVADDRVDITDGIARPPARLAGLLEVRGLGILRLDYTPEARLRLLVRLGAEGERLPAPEHDRSLGLPVLRLQASHSGTPDRIVLALGCVLGEVASLAGAFAPP